MGVLPSKQGNGRSAKECCNVGVQAMTSIVDHVIGHMIRDAVKVKVL